MKTENNEQNAPEPVKRYALSMEKVDGADEYAIWEESADGNMVQLSELERVIAERDTLLRHKKDLVSELYRALGRIKHLEEKAQASLSPYDFASAVALLKQTDK